MKTQHYTALLAAFALLASPVAMAKPKKPNIQSNTSGISDEKLIDSVSASSMGAGVAEPLKISKTSAGGKDVLVVTGSNSVKCKIPLSKTQPVKNVGYRLPSKRRPFRQPETAAEQTVRRRLLLISVWK